MKARSVLALSALIATGLAGAATAATKPVCKLVTDASKDTFAGAGSSLDILSADVASDAKKFTAVIRLAGWSASEPTSPLGRVYQVEFTGKGADTYSFLSYQDTPLVKSFNYGHYDALTDNETGDGIASGFIKGNEIHITAPVSALSAHGSFKPGAKITDISVSANRWVGVTLQSQLYAGGTSPADDAAASKGYLAGAKSCVVPGN